jgi:hypothetical protein
LKLLNTIFNNLGIDESIFYTISARLIQVLGTLVNIFIISLYLSKEEQGFYYTFGSIIGIQIFWK